MTQFRISMHLNRRNECRKLSALLCDVDARYHVFRSDIASRCSSPSQFTTLSHMQPNRYAIAAIYSRRTDFQIKFQPKVPRNNFKIQIALSCCSLQLMCAISFNPTCISDTNSNTNSSVLLIVPIELWSAEHGCGIWTFRRISVAGGKIKRSQ